MRRLLFCYSDFFSSLSVNHIMHYFLELLQYTYQIDLFWKSSKLIFQVRQSLLSNLWLGYFHFRNFTLTHRISCWSWETPWKRARRSLWVFESMCMAYVSSTCVWGKQLPANMRQAFITHRTLTWHHRRNRRGAGAAIVASSPGRRRRGVLGPEYTLDWMHKSSGKHEGTRLDACWLKTVLIPLCSDKWPISKSGNRWSAERRHWEWLEIQTVVLRGKSAGGESRSRDGENKLVRRRSSRRRKRWSGRERRWGQRRRRSVIGCWTQGRQCWRGDHSRAASSWD